MDEYKRLSDLAYVLCLGILNLDTDYNGQLLWGHFFNIYVPVWCNIQQSTVNDNNMEGFQGVL